MKEEEGEGEADGEQAQVDRQEAEQAFAPVRGEERPLWSVGWIGGGDEGGNARSRSEK